MTCRSMTVNGVGLILCGGSRKGSPCTYCSRPHALLCDFPVAEGKTCDAKLCGQCTVKDGEKDNCRVHSLRGDKPWTPAAAALLLLVIGAAGCSSSNPVAPPATPAFECSSCSSGGFCPQSCEARP
jgi:hypothetical protein